MSRDCDRRGSGSVRAVLLLPTLLGWCVGIGTVVVAGIDADRMAFQSEADARSAAAALAVRTGSIVVQPGAAAAAARDA